VYSYNQPQERALSGVAGSSCPKARFQFAATCLLVSMNPCSLTAKPVPLARPPIGILVRLSSSSVSQRTMPYFSPNSHRRGMSYSLSCRRNTDCLMEDRPACGLVIETPCPGDFGRRVAELLDDVRRRQAALRLPSALRILAFCSTSAVLWSSFDARIASSFFISSKSCLCFQ